MRIESSGLNSLNRLQAQQAFTAHQPVEEQRENLREPILQEMVQPEKVTPAKQLHQELAMDEIKQIAEQSGYMDVSDEDIHRAYVYGESLLSDYTV